MDPQKKAEEGQTDSRACSRAKQSDGYLRRGCQEGEGGKELKTRTL